MPTKTTKKTAFLDFYDPNGPKTLKGMANKMLTGDGRKKFKNLTKEETADVINTMFGAPKSSVAKKKAAKK